VNYWGRPHLPGAPAAKWDVIRGGGRFGQPLKVSMEPVLSFEKCILIAGLRPTGGLEVFSFGSAAPSRDAARAFYCMNTSIVLWPISTHQRFNPMPRLTNLQYAATCKDDDPVVKETDHVIFQRD
jgi:hypothetical protein